MPRAAIYVRVSTEKRKIENEKLTYEQDNEVQAGPLREFVKNRGWELFKVYEDRASGAKEDRAGMLQLMQDAKRRYFDIVVVWRFDRFARSVKQLINALEEFQALGINFVSYQEALDTSTPMGKTMFAVIGAMAELERAIIRERVIAGLAHAKKKGKRLGRPMRTVDARKLANMRAAGLSLRQIAKHLDVAVTTVRRNLDRNPTRT